MTKSKRSSTEESQTKIPPLRLPPPFVVPPELTANIPTRSDPKKTSPRWKTPRHFGPEPKFTPEQRRIRHIKYVMDMRHRGQKLDSYIATLEERLKLLREIRAEREGSPNEQGDIEHRAGTGKD